jgi:hypothetical protein
MDDADAEGFDGDDMDDDVDKDRDDDLDQGFDGPTTGSQPRFIPPPPSAVPSHAPISPARTMVPMAYLRDSSQSLPPPADTPRASTSTYQPPIRRGGFGDVPIVEAPASPPPPSDAESARSSGTNVSNGAGFFRTYLNRPQGANGLPSPTSRSVDGGAHTPDLIYAEIGHGRGIGPSHQTVAGPSNPHRYSPYTPVNGVNSHVLANGVGHPMTRNGHVSPTSPPAGVNSAHYQGHQVSAWSRRASLDPSVSSASSPVPPEPTSSVSSLSPTPVPAETPDMNPTDSRRSTKRTFKNALSSVFGRTSGDGGGRSGGGSNADSSFRGH